MTLTTNRLSQATPVSQPQQIALDLDEAVMSLNALLEVHHSEGLTASQDRLYERLKLFAKSRGCTTVAGWWHLPKGGSK